MSLGEVKADDDDDDDDGEYTPFIVSNASMATITIITASTSVSENIKPSCSYVVMLTLKKLILHLFGKRWTTYVKFFPEARFSSPLIG